MQQQIVIYVYKFKGLSVGRLLLDCYFVNGWYVQEPFDCFQNRWDNIKQKTRDTFQQIGKTGAGGQIFSEIDNIVLDILGRDSAYLNGVGKKSGPPNFGGHQYTQSMTTTWDETSQSNLENIEPGTAVIQ